MRPSAGLIANWMLQPPWFTPTPSMMSAPIRTSSSISLCVRVRAGATVIESPVCTPTGSTFSMVVTSIVSPVRSRIISSSSSFQPRIDSSSRTSLVSESRRPCSTKRVSSSFVCAKPEPRPPIVNEGRTTNGYPSSSAASSASCSEWAIRDLATSAPHRSTISLNSSRSSPARIVSTLEPMISTPYFSKIPASARFIAAFRAVCPPRVGRRASGRSFAMIRSIELVVIGST